MQSFFWHVLHDKRVYATLDAEVDAAVADGRLPAAGNVSWAQGQALPYFQACLKEGMRVRPAVGLNITRMVPPEGTELDGTFFPGGTRIAVNGWVLHRDKATFGADADIYRPERWTEDEERSRRMERYMFQVRCAGPCCIRFFLANSPFSRSPVWRRRPPLHRPQPGPAGDQQGAAAPAARLPLLTGAPRPRAGGPRDVFCGAGGAGRVCREEGVGGLCFPCLLSLVSCLLSPTVWLSSFIWSPFPSIACFK